MKLEPKKHKRFQFAASDPANRNQFAARIKSIVERHSNRSALAREIQVIESTLRRWEDAISEPSRDRLIALARVTGVNVLWLATGEGPMRPGESEGPRQAIGKEEAEEEKPESPVDMELLTQIIRAVEELLAERRRTLAPDKKAQVIAVLYDLGLQGMWQEDNPRTVENILRLVS